MRVTVGPLVHGDPLIEKEDGSIEIDARTPEEMLAVMLQCLQSKRWDDVGPSAAEQTRLAYDSQAEGRDAFKIEMEQVQTGQHGPTLNRMIAGLGTHEVIMDSAGPNALRIAFGPKPVAKPNSRSKRWSWSKRTLASVRPP